MMVGIWNPLHEKQLKATFLADWSKPTNRDWSKAETENNAMVAYLGGTLDLPHLPNFVKEILSHEHRALIEDYHEKHFNAIFTASLPHTVRLAKFTPHADLFKELFYANTDMMRVFQTDVKRLEYDGLHTLSVIFYSGTAATRWERKALRFQRAVIVLQNTANSDNGEGCHKRNCIVGAEVLDVEYARATKMDIYDNRYHTILVIHHFQTQVRRPCERCYSPRHGRRKCVVSNECINETRLKYSRIHTWGGQQHTGPSCAAYNVDSIERLITVMKAMPKAEDMAPHALVRHPAQVFKPPSKIARCEGEAEKTESPGLDDGYKVQLSKRAKQAFKKVHKSSLQDSFSGKPTRTAGTVTTPTADKKVATEPGNNVTTVSVSNTTRLKAPQGGKDGLQTMKRFTAFQREEARGYYAELAGLDESDEVDSESESEEDYEEGGSAVCVWKL
ncbi:hypothetical protein PHMEG_00012970 [Phytophthora megakarya]|uniref:Uncharacterized protein n=1 Tax=Phytophthora megakarya TaxID=4795 RepID=A0A225W7X4_9STRA|nr:hypothetical protein PHMEG_00012970 [Phytophthora megakarya]